MQGLIPRSFIDDLLHQTDIVEFIDSYIPLKKQGNSHVACCPFHNEKTPSFNVVAKKQFYHCFGCGESGNAISFAMNYLHLNFADAIEALALRMGLTVPREGKVETNRAAPSLYKVLEDVTTFYQNTLKNNGQIAIDYLKNRGVNGEIARIYRLGYAPEGWQTLQTLFKNNTAELITTGMLIEKEGGGTYDRYRNRIMFPIHSRNGQIIGFGGRSINEEQKPKYLNSPETVLFQKSRELYGLHQLLEQKKTFNNIIVVEGYMDVIALAQHNICNTVAALGTATSTYHVQILHKHTKQIIFCFDGDTAGRQAAWRALESSLSQLQSGLDVRFIFLPDTHDPDSLVRAEGADNFMLRVKNAKPLNKFFFEQLTAELDLTSLAGKTQLVQLAKPFLDKLPEGTYKQLMLDELARITHIKQDKLQKLTQSTQTQTVLTNTQTITRTPIRIAVALLLQNPQLYQSCIEKLPKGILDNINQPLLKILIERITATGSTNTASLIESFRDSSIFDVINKLTAWEHQVPPEALHDEFIDTIMFLSKQQNEEQIKILIEKARNNTLSDSERLVLQSKLKERHE